MTAVKPHCGVRTRMKRLSDDAVIRVTIRKTEQSGQRVTSVSASLHCRPCSPG